jgi:hypothetical protein
LGPLGHLATIARGTRSQGSCRPTLSGLEHAGGDGSRPTRLRLAIQAKHENRAVSFDSGEALGVVTLHTAYNRQRTGLRRLWAGTRTCALLTGAGLASLFLVELPTAAGAHAYSQAKPDYVPAADKWITLGTGPVHELGPAARSPVEQLSTPLLEKQQAKPQQQPSSLQLASLGRDSPHHDSAPRSLTGGQVRWSSSSGCLNATLRQVIAEVSTQFGPITINSTCRSRQHNASVGGAPHSQHLSGNAVDFSVGRNARAVLAFLGGHRAVGGLKHYADGHFHIDTGPRRTW